MGTPVAGEDFDSLVLALADSVFWAFQTVFCLGCENEGLFWANCAEIDWKLLDFALLTAYYEVDFGGVFVVFCEILKGFGLFLKEMRDGGDYFQQGTVAEEDFV